MPKQQNITTVYDKLFTIRDMLQEIASLGMEVAAISETFGGVIANEVTSKMRKTFIPSIQTYIDGSQNPVSISSLIKFLDSVPLVQIRETPIEDALATEAAALTPTTTEEETIPEDNQTPAMLPGQIAPNAGVSAMRAKTEESRNQSIRKTILEEWKARSTVRQALKTPGTLDFKELSESYKHMSPLVPDQLTGITENADRIFNTLALKEAQKVPSAHNTATRAMAHEPPISMDQWKTLALENEPII